MTECVLFLCTGNAARSQMAEAFLREYAGDHFEVYSAGVRPTGEIHPLTRTVMKEVGNPLHRQYSKSLRELYMLHDHFTYVITVCDDAAEHCPSDVLNRAEAYFHWDFPDPAAFEGTHTEQHHFFRVIRDEIAEQVQIWLEELEAVR